MTLWTVAGQTPLSTGFSRQEYWNRLQFPPLRDLPDPRIEPKSSTWAGRFFTTEPPSKPYLKWSEVKSLSRVWLFATPWIVAHQAPWFVGFSRHEYWSGLLFPSQGIFLTQGSNLGLPHRRQTLYRLSYQGSPYLGNCKQSAMNIRVHVSFKISVSLSLFFFFFEIYTQERNGWVIWWFSF